MKAKTGGPRIPDLVGTVGAVALLALVATACSTGGTGAAADHAGSGAAGAGVVVERSTGCAHPAHHGATDFGAEHTVTLDVGTISGSYELSVPRTYRSGHPTPLILLFYGFDSDPAQFSALTNLPGRGAKDGYLVAVPHTQPGESEFQFSGHGTDAAFVNAVVASLEKTYCVDRRAVFAAGFSAGAAFTIAYACAHENQIAAITTVAVEFQLGCRKPLPILAFHGTADPLVPYQNGAIGLSLPGIKVRGTELNMGDWARLDHCRSHPLAVRIGTQVQRQQWPDCDHGTSVVLYTIIGGGHAWPGANPKGAIGLTTEQVSATTEALAFFTHDRT